MLTLGSIIHQLYSLCFLGSPTLWLTYLPHQTGLFVLFCFCFEGKRPDFFLEKAVFVGIIQTSLREEPQGPLPV